LQDKIKNKIFINKVLIFISAFISSLKEMLTQMGRPSDRLTEAEVNLSKNKKKFLKI